MILVRNTFQLKFGKAKDATAKMREGLTIMKGEGLKGTRAYTDVSGPFYTLVLELTADSLADYESALSKARNNKDWQNWYASFSQLVESGGREFYSIIE